MKHVSHWTKRFSNKRHSDGVSKKLRHKGAALREGVLFWALLLYVLYQVAHCVGFLPMTASMDPSVHITFAAEREFISDSISVTQQMRQQLPQTQIEKIAGGKQEANDSVECVTHSTDDRFGYIQLTDGSPAYVYGILHVHGALLRSNSSHRHVVMLMPSVPSSQRRLFQHLGIGTFQIEPWRMDPLLKDCVNCWNVTFYKLFIFNMTQFDKLLYLDTDVGVMSAQGLDELLSDYPTPAAVCDRANPIELNGGVLLVSPNHDLFQALLRFMPRTRNSNTVDYFKSDPWNCEWRELVGDQGFINAFFNNPQVTGYGPLYALHYRYGILTSSFNNQWQRYFLYHRPQMVKNVHFTVFKPWHVDGYNMLRRVVRDISRSPGQSIFHTNEHMARFFVRYWMDVQIALNKCGQLCHELDGQKLAIPKDDVVKFLRFRPEPFVKGEIRVGFSPNDDTTKLL